MPQAAIALETSLSELAQKARVDELDFRIFVPLLTFFWFFTHLVEAFVIQHYMRKNESKLIKSIQI